MGRVVPAVARALDILELFLDDSETLSVPDVTAQLGLPRTTAHELVSTLVARGYLRPASGLPSRYQLGVKVLQLGSVYAERVDLVRLGQEAAAALAKDCDETAQVAILDGAEIVYIAKADSTRPFRMVSAVGRRLPANCTALGKMLLSKLADAELDTLYAGVRPLPAMTPKSITSLEELRVALRGVRRAGIAMENCESNGDVACVAAPVYDRTGEMVAAMSISLPASRWTNARSRALGQVVAEGALTFSERLGYRRP